MKRNSVAVIEKSIFWKEHVYRNSKDPVQKARCMAAIESLLQDLMETKRAEQETKLSRGMAEHAAWYDTSAELN
jgi:hypothetical protein